FCSVTARPPRSTLFPYTTLFRSAVEATREELAAQGSAMPGAAQALAHLASADGIAQTPVTGNLPEVAHHKLAAFDLQEHLDFGLGGFGHLSHHRHDLIADSVRKAEARTGRQIDAGSVVVVGGHLGALPAPAVPHLDHAALGQSLADHQDRGHPEQL